MSGSISRKIAFGAATSWLSRGTAIAIGLLLQPVLYRKLPNEQLGIWLLLGQTWSVLGVLDMGFGSVVTRRIALLTGRTAGATGMPGLVSNELADLVASGERVYRVLGVCAFVATCSVGYFYLRTLPIQEASFSVAWIAWFILCFSQATSLWSSIWTAQLVGTGYVGWDSLIASGIQVAIVAVQIAAVSSGGGVLYLATAAAMGAIMQRWLTQWLARRTRPELFSVAGVWRRELLHGVPQEAVRAWLTSIGTVLAFNSDAFFVASHSGAKDLPNYRAAYLVVLTLNMLSAAFVNSSSVFISHLWSSDNLPLIQSIVLRNLRLSLLIMLAGAAALFAAGPEIFLVWLGPGRYAGATLLGVFFVTLTLEAHAMVISTAARATGFEAFAFSSVLGGVGKLVLSWLFVRWFGLTGIAVATLIAQFSAFQCYAYWKGLRRLEIPIRTHVTFVAIPCGAIGLGMYLLNASFLSFLPESAVLPRLITCVLTTGICFASAVWLWVLTQSERGYVLSKGAFLKNVMPG